MGEVMSPDMLVIVIAAFCGFSDSRISRNYKEICLEKAVNCAIIKDGSTTNKLVDKCKGDWIEYAKDNNLK